MKYDFSIEDQLFFVSQNSCSDSSVRYSASLPYDWHELSNNSEWTNQYPIGYNLDRQGWKVHISSDYKHSHEVLSIVSKICHEFNVVFKYLKTEKAFILRNGKNVDRGYSGKFITCYPNIEILESFLNNLEDALKGFNGPYILSDKRWKSAPIYLRYGVFRDSIPGEEIELKSDELLINGEIVKDLRLPQFSVPKGINIPQFLKTWINDFDGSPDDEFPITIDSAIRFSNSGGIYNAKLKKNNQEIILRESRPYTGLDFSGEYSLERLKAEKKALDLLKDVPQIPNVVWSGKVWEHSYLGVEKMQGIPLNNWVTNNYPLYSADGKEKYLQRVKKIITQLVKLLELVHLKSVYHQDIHFGNILIDHDDTVSLIDWEQARFSDATKVDQKMAAPGYGSWIEDYPSQIDWNGLKQVAHYLYFPLVEQSSLVYGYEKQTVKAAHNIFKRLGYSDEDMISIENILDSIDNKCTDFENLSEKKILKPFFNDLEINSFDDINDILQKLGRGLSLISSEWQKLYKSERAFPVHYYGLEINQGLAFSDLGVLWSYQELMHAIGEETDSEYESLKNQIIDSAMLNFDNSTPGFFDGVVGSIWLIHELGEQDLAYRLFDQYVEELLKNCTHSNLYSGTAGVLLTGIYFISKNQTMKSKEKILSELDIFANKYFENPKEFCEVGFGKITSNDPYKLESGLLYGHTGIGWLFGEAYRLTGNIKYKECLDLAIKTELLGYEENGVSGLQYSQNQRLLPYLSMGSGGLLLVLLKNKDIIDSELLENVALLKKAVSPCFCVFPGLFNGYCGLVLSKCLYNDCLDKITVFKELIAGLQGYICMIEEGIGIAGDSGLKLTTDIASGLSGIILSLVSIQNQSLKILPSL